jgi:predicted MFS family arabinose efflux permease
MLKKTIALYREAYAGLPRGAWILALAEFINRSGFMVFVFLNIYLTRRLNFSLNQAGRVLSAYGLGAIAGGYIGGHLSDKIGARGVQISSLTLSGLLLIVTAYGRTYGQILPLIFSYGIIAAALFPANDTAMARFTPDEMRPKGFALRRLASNLGITIGPIIGGFLILLDYRWMFWADGLTSIAAAAVIAVLMRGGPLRPEPKTASPALPSRSPWRDGPFLMFLGLFLIEIIVFAQLFSTFTLYLNLSYGLKENQIGPLWAVNTLMIVFIEMVLLHSLRKRSNMRLIALGAGLIGLGFALLPLGRGFFYAALTVAVWTMGEILTMPLTATVTAGRGGESAGKYLGLLSLTFSLSMFIAPSLGNWLLGTIGGDALWPVAGGAAALSGLGFLILKPRLEPAAQPVSPTS